MKLSFFRYLFFTAVLLVSLAVFSFAYFRYQTVHYASKDYLEPHHIHSSAKLILEGFDIDAANKQVLSEFAKKHHDEKNLKDLVVLVTGATKGIGRGVAAHLASFGAKLVLPCRKCNFTQLEEQLNQDAFEYHNRYSSKKVSKPFEIKKPIIFNVDFADLDQIDDFVKNYMELELPPFDVFVSNAGLVSPEHSKTKQGFELTFGVNYLAACYLTQKLLDNNLIKGRIISVSSEDHRSVEEIAVVLKKNGNLKLGQYFSNGIIDVMVRYDFSKLLQTTYFLALSKKIPNQVIDMCPGPVASEIAGSAPWPLGDITKYIMTLLLRRVDDAAIPITRFAISNEYDGVSGRHFHIVEEKPARKDATDPVIQELVFLETQELIRMRRPPQ